MHSLIIILYTLTYVCMYVCIHTTYVHLHVRRFERIIEYQLSNKTINLKLLSHKISFECDHVSFPYAFYSCIDIQFISLFLYIGN